MSHAPLKMEIIALLSSVEDEDQLLTIKKLLQPTKKERSANLQKYPNSKWAIDPKKILNLVAQVDQYEKKISQSEKEKATILIETYELIRRAIMDWQPAYNEKAVYIDIEQQTAWHLWRVESYREETLRFKEAPAEIDRFHNYYSIDLSKLIEVANFLIIPKDLFEEINGYLPFTVYPDKHEKYGIN